MDKPKRKRYTREAHTASNNKYNASHTIQLNVRLNLKTDADIVAFMDGVENKRAYILGLIREDMARRSDG